MVIFQLLDQLISAASAVAAEQVASMVSSLTPCAAAWNSQKQPARFNCTLEDPYRELS